MKKKPSRKAKPSNQVKKLRDEIRKLTREKGYDDEILHDLLTNIRELKAKVEVYESMQEFKRRDVKTN